MLISELLCRMRAWLVEMKPIPPMSAASAYTSSIPSVASRQLFQCLRSSIRNSSACVGAYSGFLMSAPRTQ